MFSTITSLLRHLIAISLLVIGSFACGQELKTSENFGQHTVHFSVFNTTSISPEIAQLYNTVRSKDRVLINIAMVENANLLKGGQAATVSGTATNLLQQRQSLKFQTVHEGEVFYYIAEVRITNEDMLLFDVEVTPEGSNESYRVKFRKTVYYND